MLSTEGFDPFTCEVVAPGWAAALGVDSIEGWQDAAKAPPGTDVVDSDGTACASASDQAACLAALEAARNQPRDTSLEIYDMYFTRQYYRLIVTDGDEVKTIDDGAELSALLGPIDAASKAGLVSQFSMVTRLQCEHARRTGEGFELIGTRFIRECPVTTQRQLVQISPAGEVSVLAVEAPVESWGCAGRRPAGLATQAVACAGALARYLERQAYLEAASVEAFDRLALELEALGAPAQLAERARRAGADEVRHHALLVALGRRFDPAFSCQAPAAASSEPRSLLAFALENGVEGCVRETWGALLAHHQAERATDEAARFAFQLIADDETRHAELSWAVHAWLLGQLSEGDRRTLEAAMVRAAGELLDEVGAGKDVGEGERGLLGLPSVGEARALVGRLHEALWVTPLAA